MKRRLVIYSSSVILLLSCINNNHIAAQEGDMKKNNHGSNDNAKKSSSTTNLRRGRLLLLQQQIIIAPVRPSISFDSDNNIINDDDDDTDNATTTTTSLIEPYKEDPFTSNVNDFFNTTHNTTSQRITYHTPTIMSIAPSSSPGLTTSWIQRSHQPSNSIPTTAFNNYPTTIDRSYASNNNNNDDDDDTDLKEFIAFVGWYVFLIFCCILPTICTYYKRRRNAYLLNENIHSIRMRLEEMERNNNNHGGGGGLNHLRISTNGGIIMGNEESVIRLGERDQDWEFLESLFGSSSSSSSSTRNDTTTSTTTTNNNVTMYATNNDTDRRRQIIMSDILGGMSSIRTIIEREQRRKRERGRRLVGLLKECSLEISECHLIPKEIGGGSISISSRGGGGGIECVVGGQQRCVSNEEEEDEEGDIELGTVQNNEIDVVNSKGGDYEEALESKKHAAVDKQSQVKNDVDVKPSVRKGGDEEIDVVEESCQHRNADETSDEAATVEEDNAPDSTTTIDTMLESATTTLQPKLQKSDGINTQSSLLPSAADNATTTSDKNNSILSLYQTDDIVYDDDDDDNKYSALCLPCTPTHKDATVLSVARSVPPPQSTIDYESSTRLVPPTCSICLISYSPGCYVTWSSNPECIHVFHRDCILVWLLKKEEPLCPCCRREFVSSSTLNTATTTATGGAGENGDSVDQFSRTLILERSRALAASRPSRRLARMSSNNPATASPWDSFDDVGLGRAPRSSSRRFARMSPH